MSGGPWITPDEAMRHLIYSRKNVTGGEHVALNLEVPQPSDETWRDYKDVAVIAIPTPEDDNADWLKPTSINSYPEDTAWSDWDASGTSQRSK